MSSPKIQCEILMNDLAEFSEKMLRLHGEFHPYGGYLNKNELVVQVGVSPEIRWESDKQRMDALLSFFRELAKEKAPLAFGIVTNVDLRDGNQTSNAIKIFLEHVSGYCADIFMRYDIDDDGIVSIVNVTAQQGVPNIFPKQ